MKSFLSMIVGVSDSGTTLGPLDRSESFHVRKQQCCDLRVVISYFLAWLSQNYKEVICVFEPFYRRVCRTDLSRRTTSRLTKFERTTAYGTSMSHRHVALIVLKPLERREIRVGIFPNVRQVIKNALRILVVAGELE